MAEFAGRAFDGGGARRAGGRWNSRGVKMVYTSSSAALAALELLVRIVRRELFRKYVLFACTFEDHLVETVEHSALPGNWRLHPAPPKLQKIGDAWTKRASNVVLRVPSVIVETEFNYLFNPAHPEFPRIHIAEPTPFALDLRLLRR